jgi:hypothetical protein
MAEGASIEPGKPLMGYPSIRVTGDSHGTCSRRHAALLMTTPDTRRARRGESSGACGSRWAKMGQ